MKIVRIEFRLHLVHWRARGWWLSTWHSFVENLSSRYPWRDDYYGFRIAGIGFEFVTARQDILSRYKVN